VRHLLNVPSTKNQNLPRGGVSRISRRDWRKRDNEMTIAAIGLAYVLIVLTLMRFVHVLHEREEKLREQSTPRIARSA